MREDLRSTLGARPESLVILYSSLPFRSFFQQSADGPATRELLGDPTVRAYFVSQCPPDVPPERLAILAFDPEACRMRLVPRSRGAVLASAAAAVVGGHPQSVGVWLRYGHLEDDHSLGATSVRAAARLLLEGADAYRAELARGGLADTLGDAPSRLVRQAASEGYPLPSGLRAVLRNPTSAAAHIALAESLLARDAVLLAGLEASVASGLGAGTGRESYVLGLVKMRRGYLWEAEAAFRAALARDPHGPYSAPAREWLDQIASHQRQLIEEAASQARSRSAP